MARRQTYIGTLYRTDPAKCREELVRFIRRQKGCVTLAARDAGMSRRNFQYYLHRESLWEVLEQVRREAVEAGEAKHIGLPRPAAAPAWVQKTRAALRGARHESHKESKNVPRA